MRLARAWTVPHSTGSVHWPSRKCNHPGLNDCIDANAAKSRVRAIVCALCPLCVSNEQLPLRVSAKLQQFVTYMDPGEANPSHWITDSKNINSSLASIPAVTFLLLYISPALSKMALQMRQSVSVKSSTRTCSAVVSLRPTTPRTCFQSISVAQAPLASTRSSVRVEASVRPVRITVQLINQL